MPTILMYVRSLPLIPTRIILFTSLLISVCIFSVNQVPQITPRSSIIYSQDISLITDLPKQRQRLDYLLLANPLEDFPHFIIKYKDQSKLVSVKIPQATQINLEREVLLKNKIPFAIAQKEWLDISSIIACIRSKLVVIPPPSTFQESLIFYIRVITQRLVPYFWKNSKNISCRS